MLCTNLRFLVVEDHDFQRRVFVRLLTALGAAIVYSAENGESALAIVRDAKRPVDIVITDLSMPGMDGMEFVRHLSENGAPVSVILSSSAERNLLASVANMVREYGVRLLGVIGKPPSEEKLQPLVALHRLGQREVADPKTRFSFDEIAQGWAHDEIEPRYEPCVDIETRAVCCMSATPRWQHYQQGTLGPDAFMASVVARGLADDFAEMMLEKSAAHCAAWKKEGPEPVVAVRLSFRSLAGASVAGRVREIVLNQGLDPSRMLLMVPGTALESDLAKVLETIARLRLAGFGLGLDDIGPHVGGLRHLSLIDISTLRIGPQTASAERAAGLALAAELGLQSVASDVASPEQWLAAKAAGFTQAQGPAVSAPLRAGAVPSWSALTPAA